MVPKRKITIMLLSALLTTLMATSSYAAEKLR